VPTACHLLILILRFQFRVICSSLFIMPSFLSYTGLISRSMPLFLRATPLQLANPLARPASAMVFVCNLLHTHILVILSIYLKHMLRDTCITMRTYAFYFSCRARLATLLPVAQCQLARCQQVLAAAGYNSHSH
jgi:hypothetical protein